MSKKFHIILCSLLIIGISGCATTPRIRPSIGEKKLKALCDQHDIRWEWDNISQLVTLSRKKLTAKLFIDSNIALVDNSTVFLSKPVRIRRSVVYVPFDFESKVMNKLLAEVAFVIKKFKSVVIDPGHGGKDPGATGRTGLREKEVVFDIALRLKKKLKKKGISVIMTRNSDEFVSLEERTRIASRAKADLFVSIHANASHSRWVNGFEVFHCRDKDYFKNPEIVLRKNSRERFKYFSMKKTPILEKILLDMMYVYKKYEGKRLGEFIARRTSSDMNLRNRGSKPAGFFVLRNTLIPAILVEVGFLSNETEEKLLKESWYRQKIADSLSKNILNYAQKTVQ